MKIRQRILSFLIAALGICMIAYPWISNYLYERSVTSEVDSYTEAVSEVDEEDYDEMLRQAQIYNDYLVSPGVKLTDPFSETADTKEGVLNYYDLLNISGTGLMGYVNIPVIGASLPIYHGTSSEVLEKGVGHLENSSLPIGGESTHSVLTGHTGLSSKKLFTDLIDLEEGDLFFVHVLDRTLAYKVTDIYVVLPDDTSKLEIVEGEDLCTLLTCTPYGVNDHRLLVRGERTTYNPEDENGAKKDIDSQWMRTYREAIIIGLLLVMLCIDIVLTVRRIRTFTKKGGGNRKS